MEGGKRQLVSETNNLKCHFVSLLHDVQRVHVAIGLVPITCVSILHSTTCMLQMSGLEEVLEYCELEKQFASQNTKDGSL